MFNFFKRKGGKADAPDDTRKQPTADTAKPTSVDARASLNENDVTNEKSNTLRKDVVNLLLPETDYNQKTGVSALLQMMAGKRRRTKKKTRAESCRVSPPKETHVNLQRSKSDLEPKRGEASDDVAAPTPDENSRQTAHADADPAEFVKALVLQKYAKPPEAKQQHVSMVYVSNEPDLDEKRHTEALLRVIARSIDCTIDEIEQRDSMGTSESKTSERDRKTDPVYETIDERNVNNNNTLNSYKSELKNELEKLLQVENVNKEETLEKAVNEGTESPALIKKSNLKPPRSDTEGCSDDDRSDNGNKRITFNKHIVFDDGDQQTDEDLDSSFESLTSEEEEGEEYLEDCLPDNDERLGGFVVKRKDGNENKTVINVSNACVNDSISIKIECPDDEEGLKRISSDNSDSGFLEISDKNDEYSDDVNSVQTLYIEEEVTDSEVSGSETEIGSEEEVEIVEIIEEIDVAKVVEPDVPSVIVTPEVVTPTIAKHEIIIKESEESQDSGEEIEVSEEDEYEEVTEETEESDEEIEPTEKTLVNQESKFQNQVAALTELADTRCGEAETARELISTYRKEIEEKDQEIERLKSDLEAAYKESELLRQRGRSLEEELSAARSCSADLAGQLQWKNDESIRQLRGELDDALHLRAELESRVLALERDRERLEQDKILSEQRAQEALQSAEASTAKWRLAHEAARTQAAARAERMLADCEWKMRELEKRARDAEKSNKELTESVDQLKSTPKPSASQLAELQQLRGLATEQQRSVQALTLQLQQVETREEALKLEVHRLKELLEKVTRIGKEKEERHMQQVDRLSAQHSKAIETLKAEYAVQAAQTRATLERVHAERTRNALASLRTEAETTAKNADRKLREVTTRFENLKEVLASKESQFERAISEAHSKADWDIMQLRHMLDKSDITYANKIEEMNERFEKEKERLIEEWSTKVQDIEEKAAAAADDSRKLLETTRAKLIAEKNDMIHKLKEQHRNEMDEQWEQFMSDKEHCLARMKSECRQEGEEERVKREKDLLEEITELRSQVQSKSVEFETLATKTAACGRTLEVTEQELREALMREKELREKRAEDATLLKQAERSSKDQIEHLTRKCACLRKLFDDMRARLGAREQAAEQVIKDQNVEINQLKAEVARLTKLLTGQISPQLGARTQADGCEKMADNHESYKTGLIEPNQPRRKGGTLRTPEFARKRAPLPELTPLPPEARRTSFDSGPGRKRSQSVDLPAVQVPTRIKQLEEKTKE